MQLTSDPTVELDAHATTPTVVGNAVGAKLDAVAVVAAARAEADGILAEAKREAFQIYRSASADAQQLVDGARADAARIVAAAGQDMADTGHPQPAIEAAKPAVQAVSPYDIVDEPEPEAASPFDEPLRESRYAKHAAEIPRLGDDAGRDAIATATSLRNVLRK